MLNRGKSRQGFAVVIVLAIFLAIMLVVSFLLQFSKIAVKRSQELNDKLLAKLYSQSAFEILKFVLSTSEMKSNYILNRSFSNLPNRLDVTGIPIKFNHSEVRIYDLSSRINVLTLSRQNVEGLFNLIKEGTDKSDIAFESYLDWKDQDNFPHPSGAESEFYKTLGLKYSPRNNWAIQSKEELRDIRGFRFYYNKFAKYLSINYNSYLFNINTASKEEFMIFFNIPEDQATQLIEIRTKKGFLSFSDVNNVLGKRVDFDSLGTYPAGEFVIEIRSNVGDACDRIKAIISLRESQNKPFNVEEYRD